jgi:hypothetical protein
MTISKLISEKRLFILLLVLSLLPVWTTPYFLTADGPCHAYNANILYDMLHGKADFYKEFYYLNTTPEPNWFTHVLLVLLFHICGPVLADKLIITAAILLFTTGFRKLLLTFTRENAYLSLWVFPFIWQMAMLMGFYNYMLSIGSAFWISAWFITNYKDLHIGKILLLALAFTTLYFMHLFGCFLAFIICGLYVLAGNDGIRQKAKHIGLLILSALPCLVLICSYILANSGRTNNSGRPPFGDLLSDLNNLNSLFGLTRADVWHSMKMSSLLQLLILGGLILFAFRKPKRQFFIPLFLSLLFILAYFFMYETTFGGSNIRPRFEALIYLFGILTIAFAHIPKPVLIASVCASVYCSLAFSLNKIPAYRDASLFVSEIRATSKHISDKSLVLPLNLERFLHNKDGVVINNNILLFAHAAEAMPHDKQLIFMENYEATTGYFPLTWKGETNPFIHLAVNDGLEEEPPRVDIQGYNKKVTPIRYILIWGMKKEDLSDPAFAKAIQVINSSYKLVYTSPAYRIGLYELIK